MIDIAEIIEKLNALLWGFPMITILLGTHIYLTIRLGFIQRYVGRGIRFSVQNEEGAPGAVSSFSSLATALAATLGTGNIVGVASAIALGGPGAVFWCWACGVFGMATNYSEALLAVKYRVPDGDGGTQGGPMYILSKALKMPGAAKVYCVFTMLAGLGAGNMVQANSAGALLEQTFQINPILSGAVLSMLTAFVILGGIRSIAGFCEKLVPFMAIFFVGGCLAILLMNYIYIPSALALIFRDAFSLRATAAGAAGAAIRYGIARGLFTNEAGMGSSAIAAAAARTKSPVRQALVAYTATFWDTVVLCALTGVTLVTGMLRNPQGTEGLGGAALTGAVFAQLPVIGPAALTIALLTFVFATLIGWCYFAEQAARYLFGDRVLFLYRLLWIAAVMLGTMMAMPLVWNLSDTMNVLMAIPNLFAVLLLSGVTVRETRRCLSKPSRLQRL